MYTKRNLLVTTTNTIEGATIQEYRGVIAANIVMGINIIKEFVAAFSDFFGGTSGKYGEEMDRAFYLAMDILEDKAVAQKANAVVGVKIDYDEISGGGKSMLMVSISGTAVVAQFQDRGIKTTTKDSISHDTLMRLYQMEQFQTKLSDNSWMPKEIDWEIILKENMVELVPLLLKKYIKARIDTSNYYENTQNNSLMSNNFHILLDKLSYEDSIPLIYGDWGDDVSAQIIYAELINTHRLFNAEAILSKLPVIDKHVAISLLKAAKSDYEKKDLDSMIKIVNFFNNLPETGHYEDTKGGLFSKGGKVMVCERGHKTSIEKGAYCNNLLDDGSTCGLNIKGLDATEVQTINDFISLVSILEKNLVE